MFKVVTWNVNSINMRLERLLALLQRSRPDVVCLQELKCLEEKFPFEAIKAAGYECHVYGQKTYNGVALLSKAPMNGIQRGFEQTTESDPAARLIRGRTQGVEIVCCYCPNGQEVGSDKYAYKLEWYRRLKELLQRSYKSDQSLIVTGDFNVAPEDRDVYDPSAWKDKILCSEPERQALKELCSLGLKDSFRMLHSEEGLFSWWDYRALGFQKNHGMRIDFILASADLAKKCRSASIDRDERKGEKPSDHAPVSAEFDL